MIAYSMFFYVFVLTVFYPVLCVVGSIFIRIIGDRIKKDYSLEPTVTVIMSAFREGEGVYHTIESLRACDYPVEKLEIIAYDDCSPDDTFVWLQKAALDFPNVHVARNKSNQGKSLTVIDMSRQATGEFLVSVDSDGMFDSRCIRELMACFSDPRVGGVGGQFGIRNVNDTFLTQAQTIIYGFSFNFLKIVESFVGRVQCLGGPLVSFRRQTFLDMIPLIEQRSFFGERITNGEDRAITQFILSQNLRTVINMRARCLVSTPDTWRGYLNQQLRWRRSALGQWIECIIQSPQRMKTSSFTTVAGSLLPMTSLLSWIVLAAYLFVTGFFLQFIISLIFIHAMISPVFGLLFNSYMRSRHPDQMIENPILAPMVLAIWFPISMFFISIVTLFTLDDGGWVTRQTTHSQS
jgi:cellulose synthase/poly-beta-1,6-N-acetylglucosamine synthase-like glycosyltransferase